MKATKEEYQRLKDLLAVVKDKRNAPGLRRLAMAGFDRLYNRVKRRG